MITLKIDGLPVTALEGTTVLEAAQSVGIRIPTLCNYEGLPPYGACRICLVELVRGKTSRLEASCTLPVAQGMTVITNSEKVKHARKVILELLLASCPNSKTLQDMAANIGLNKVRFKVKDRNCILCGLCVRMCASQMRSGGIGFVGRGTSRRVSTPFSSHPEECRNCGACEWVCPACERACTAGSLKDALCGGCQNREPVQTCEICVECSQAVSQRGHKVF